MASKKLLIDANAFLKSLEWECGDVCEQTEYSDYLECEYGFSREAINELVQKLPTVDAVEVVHGRWVWDVETHGDPMYGIDEDFGYRCSECQVWADEYGVDGDIYEEPPTHILHYCPNCGAKMDGDGNG